MAKKARTAADHPLARLSPRLRALLVQLEADVPAQVQRMLEAERGVIPEYAAIHDSELERDVLAATTMHTRLWYGALRAGRPPTASELEPLGATGRRRARQGIPLASMLHAIRIASIVLWNALLAASRDNAEVRDELLLKVSPYLLQHFDLMGQTISAAYHAALHQEARWQDRVRHELCTAIFTDTEDLARFRENARALGLDPGADYAALALQLSDPPADEYAMQSRLDSLQAAAAQALQLPADAALRTLRQGHLVLWLPLVRGERVTAFETRVLERAAKLIGSAHGVVAAGLGLADSGPKGLRASAEQALRAIEVGGGPVLRYSDIALDDAVLGYGNISRFFLALLEPLAAEPQLAETLQALFEHRLYRKSVAAALGIHPNTLAYRLERIETLLGVKLDNPVWLAKLHTALRLKQLRAGVR
ncbi:MAG TPA: helix-turn-helix domain-containing protein [Solimonas sp.]|nr:helix-turn-helix domain-containing protein [Solimonas sp.]